MHSSEYTGAAPNPWHVTTDDGVERQLRAVLKGARNEPGAADLSYGEMEMRRAAARRGAGWGERWLLGGYRLVSGYGLRASRSLARLTGLIVVAAVMLRYKGFPGVTQASGSASFMRRGRWCRLT
jgi:hypothetical protein